MILKRLLPNYPVYVHVCCFLGVGRTHVPGFYLVELVNSIRTEDRTSSLSRRVRNVELEQILVLILNHIRSTVERIGASLFL